jgi:hypothetical protein
MAKSTKSTKAKTKTSNKSQVATKSKSAKTTKKSTSTKVTKKPAVKTTKVESVKKEENKTAFAKMSPLQRIYAGSIVVYLAIAAAAFFLMNSLSFQLSVGYWGKDELKSVNGTQFAPATQGIVDVEAKWLVMAIAIVSVIVPLLYLTRLKSSHTKQLKDRIMTTRWIDMAIVGALMIETVAILSGVLDIGTLKLMGGLMVITMLAGWFAEKRTSKENTPAVREYYLGMLSGLLPWLVILSYAIFTYVFGDLRSPWYVYVLYVVMLVGAGLMGKLQLASLKKQGNLSDYSQVEKKYAVNSLVLRTIFAVVLIVGFLG